MIGRPRPRNKILVLSAADLSNNDGYVGHLRLVCELLCEAGAETHILGFSTGEPLIRPATLTSRSNGLAALTWAALQFVVRLPATRPAAVVITAAGAPFNPLIAAVCSLLKVPLLYDCQDPPIEGVQRLYGDHPFFPALKAYLIRGQSLIDRAATLTLSVSPGLDALMRERGWKGPISRFYNIHNAIDPTPSAYSPRALFEWATNPILVYVGGLQPKIRGLEDQVRTVRELNAEGLQLRFLIAYASGDPGFLQDIADDLIADGTIRLVKNLSPQDVFACLYESDVAISTTLDFALPSKIFEYLAAGVRVISRDSDTDVVNLFSGFIATYDGSVDSMKAAISTALGEANRPGQKHAGRALIENLRRENLRSIKEFCHQALPGHPGI